MTLIGQHSFMGTTKYVNKDSL